MSVTPWTPNQWKPDTPTPTPRRKRSNLLRQLRARGFDQSYRSTSGGYRVKCSQCEALVINGCATHETGCPHGR